MGFIRKSASLKNSRFSALQTRGFNWVSAKFSAIDICGFELGISTSEQFVFFSVCCS